MQIYNLQMKTNQELQSPDRELFGVVIRQDTRDSFLCLTDLQNAYELKRGELGWSDRDLNNILSTASVKERVYYLLQKREIITPSFSGFMESANRDGIVSLLKRIGVYRMSGKAENRKVMCDPYIWVLLAMEMNPEIYAEVVMWLTDRLIFDRIEAGDNFRPMNNAISKIVDKPEYYKFAIEINRRIFGQHYTGIRNIAKSKELKLIAKIETSVKDMIELGFLKSEEDIMKVIQNITIQ